MKKNKLYCILGMSASGKSSIENRINKSGFADKIISTTTRKIRLGLEQNSVDYYFLPTAVFNAYLKQGVYAEHSTYTTVDGVAQYGINKNDIRLYENNQICVINRNGYHQLLKNLGEDTVVGIYIHREDRERIVSALKRDTSNFDNVFKEVCRRYEADKIDFAGIENEVKYIVENKDLDDTVQEIIRIIEVESNMVISNGI